MSDTIREINKGYSFKDLSRAKKRAGEIGGNKKYKNLETGKIKTLFEIGYLFMEDSFKFDKNTAHPDTIELKYIIKEGENIVKQGGFRKIKEG